jgi:hypothetical protein
LRNFSFLAMPCRFAARKARSLSQITRPNAKIYRFGSDQDAPLPWLSLKRMATERFTRALDQVVVEVRQSAQNVAEQIPRVMTASGTITEALTINRGHQERSCRVEAF